jgi:hypothetical protein
VEARSHRHRRIELKRERNFAKTTMIIIGRLQAVFHFSVLIWF